MSQSTKRILILSEADFIKGEIVRDLQKTKILSCYLEKAENPEEVKQEEGKAKFDEKNQTEKKEDDNDEFKHHRMMAGYHSLKADELKDEALKMSSATNEGIDDIVKDKKSQAKKHAETATEHREKAKSLYNKEKHGEWNDTIPTKKDALAYGSKHAKQIDKETENLIEKEEDVKKSEDVEKAEGSRGGKVIGHTKSGKPIYSHKLPSEYKDFSTQDHADASEVHRKERVKNDKKKLTLEGGSAAHNDVVSASNHHDRRFKQHLEQSKEDAGIFQPHETVDRAHDQALKDDVPKHKLAEHIAAKTGLNDQYVSQYLTAKEKEGNKVRKSFEILAESVIEKSTGEGSRGGKVIGHTKDGKPIYAHDLASSHTVSDLQHNVPLHIRRDMQNGNDWIRVAREVEAHEESGKGKISKMSREERKKYDEKLNNLVNSRKELHSKYRQDLFDHIKKNPVKQSPLEKQLEEARKQYKEAPEKGRYSTMSALESEMRRGELVVAAERRLGKHWTDPEAEGALNPYRPFPQKAFDKFIKENTKESKPDVKKSLELLGVDLIEKAEGSRGGKVIGHTKSGKPIYNNSNHIKHANFTAQDHYDAAEVHKNIKAANSKGESTGKTISGESIYKDKNWQNSHYQQSMHTQAGNILKNAENKKAIEKVKDHVSNKLKYSDKSPVKAHSSGYHVKDGSSVHVYDNDGKFKETQPSSFWNSANAHVDMHKEVGTAERKGSSENVKKGEEEDIEKGGMGSGRHKGLEGEEKTTLQQIHENPTAAYHKLITSKELADKHSELVGKEMEGKTHTTKDHETAVKNALVKMHTEGHFNKNVKKAFELLGVDVIEKSRGPWKSGKKVDLDEIKHSYSKQIARHAGMSHDEYQKLHPDTKKELAGNFQNAHFEIDGALDRATDTLRRIRSVDGNTKSSGAKAAQSKIKILNGQLDDLHKE